MFHASRNQKKVRGAILLSDKIDFNPNMVTRDKEGHDVMINLSTHQEDIIINIYAPNIGTPKYIKHIPIDLKGDTTNNTIIVGNFNIHFQQ